MMEDRKSRLRRYMEIGKSAEGLSVPDISPKEVSTTKRTINWFTTPHYKELYDGTEGPANSPDPFECWILSKMAQDATGTILEVGTWRGRSGSFLSIGASPGTRLICVDHFKGDETGGAGADEEKCRSVFEKFDINAEIVKVDALTADWGRILMPEGERIKEVPPVSLVFYDALHTYEATYKIIKDIAKYVRPDGKVVIHDAGWPDVSRAIKDLILSKLYRGVIYIDVWEGLQILQRSDVYE